jgi:hypothetical protein
MPTKQTREQVLDLIKHRGPIGAVAIGKDLNVTEKQARSAIDQLRLQGHLIWNDPARQEFWWSDQHTGGNGWKRAFDAGLKALTAPSVLERTGEADLSAAAPVRDRSIGSSHAISPSSWKNLIEVSTRVNWARPGVFATAESAEYKRGGSKSILYVGKSLGALGEELGLGLDQDRNAEIATKWMEEWSENNSRSNFWHFAKELSALGPLAWTNVIKIDVPATEGRDRGKPPKRFQVEKIKCACVAALVDELRELRPKIAVVVNGDYANQVIVAALSATDYVPFDGQLPVLDSVANSVWYRPKQKQWAIQSRHPQGASCAWRKSMITLVGALLNQHS